MRLIYSILLMFTCLTYGQGKDHNLYSKYIDSAYATYVNRPELATAYLDSIPKPVEQNLKNYLADYYRLKVLLNDKSNDSAELFHNSLLALKYAKAEKNYDIAGISAVELFYNSYIIRQDSTAFSYLEDAETYFKKANNFNGLAEVKQMYAYVELHKNNYDKSNALILKHLPEYKNIEDDGYYYMYALFMLSSNYIHKGNLEESHTYFQRLKALKQDTTISKYMFDVHKVSLNLCIADYHLDKLHLDSTKYYLKTAEKLRYAMNNSDVELYFKVYQRYFEHINDLEGKSRYIDSLANFQAELLAKNITASVNINKSLTNSENQLEIESSKKQFNKKIVIVLLIIVSILFSLFIFLNKKYKLKIKDYINKAKTSSDLKSNHEKLKVKVVGLEQYIIKIKDEVKMISSITEPLELRKKIKELYKNIHLKSSTELMSGESHLELINDLNTEFFTKIKTIYPQLNESEIIICYYVYTGFKNKEIAGFLNVSVRSVESKRYRINKKLEINTKETNLPEHLQRVLS